MDGTEHSETIEEQRTNVEEALLQDAELSVAVELTNKINSFIEAMTERVDKLDSGIKALRYKQAIEQPEDNGTDAKQLRGINSLFE